MTRSLAKRCRESGHFTVIKTQLARCPQIRTGWNEARAGMERLRRGVREGHGCLQECRLPRLPRAAPGAAALTHPARSSLAAGRSVAVLSESWRRRFQERRLSPAHTSLSRPQTGPCSTTLHQRQRYDTSRGVLNPAVSREQRQFGDPLLAVPSGGGCARPARGVGAIAPCRVGRGHLTAQSGGPRLPAAWATMCGRMEGTGGHRGLLAWGDRLASLLARRSRHGVRPCLPHRPLWGPPWALPPARCGGVSPNKPAGVFSACPGAGGADRGARRPLIPAPRAERAGTGRARLAGAR